MNKKAISDNVSPFGSLTNALMKTDLCSELNRAFEMLKPIHMTDEINVDRNIPLMLNNLEV
jgi:hypothetical protein